MEGLLRQLHEDVHRCVQTSTASLQHGQQLTHSSIADEQASALLRHQLGTEAVESLGQHISCRRDRERRGYRKKFSFKSSPSDIGVMNAEDDDGRQDACVRAGAAGKRPAPARSTGSPAVGLGQIWIFRLTPRHRGWGL
ncbi:hypothetical protein EYF80_010429 [Liparis tanakae]|uniref:Uncharacterized protein n=1 Tax=Liparis tanakae TaxID=230148 RepID=A0A4Z2ING8_9TELE|nr:hypothetical protein EYF80_010429 [Liparis tanakae]